MYISNMIDVARAFRGDDYVINDYIKIHQPTLGEIFDYGEQNYYAMINSFCSVPQNMTFQLEDLGIDYTKITGWELFYNILYNLYSVEETSIIFGDLDFQKFEVVQSDDGHTVYLKQHVIKLEKEYLDDNRNIFQKLVDKLLRRDIKTYETNIISYDIIIDEPTYIIITDYLRACHGIVKDESYPANEITRKMQIQIDRDRYKRNKDKPYKPFLPNLISAMTNSAGFGYNSNTVWDMKIFAFMDSVKRISKIQNANLLLQSGYSGYGVSLKDIDKKQLDWLGEL